MSDIHGLSLISAGLKICNCSKVLQEALRVLRADSGFDSRGIVTIHIARKPLSKHG